MAYSYERTAFFGKTLLDTKIDWSYELAEAIAKQFTVGGWHEYRMKAHALRSRQGTDLIVESGTGTKWKATVYINVEAASPNMLITIHTEPSTGPVDLVKMWKEVEDNSKLFDISDRLDVSSIAGIASAWVSRMVTPLLRAE